MRKGFFFVLLFVTVLWGAESTGNGMAELYADSFESRGDTVYAKGNVVLSYDGTLFLGERARYDRKANVVIVEGNVEILGNRGNKILADKVVFEVEKNHVTFQNFYESDRDDIWVYADDAQRQDRNYTLRNSMLSSCSPENPDWTVRFEEARYDSEKKYIKLKNARLYAKKVPVLYTPYLGFSLDRQRSSGFLMPHFGYGADEGFYYEQPYFWAISPSLDMEFNPSIRTNRGYGIYGTFRFADSPWSRGTIRTGYFRDKDSFVQEHNLKNDTHYGVELLYESSNVLRDWKPKGYREGLYVNINLFNDIDYENLQYGGLNHLEETSRYKESRLNYFLYDDRQYFGLRGRYFIDTSSLENNETIQELPSLQYHKFSTPLAGGLLEYAMDAQLQNYWREEGTRAMRGLASLPVSFHTGLFGSYLNLAIEEEFRASDTKFYDNLSSPDLSQDHYASVVLNHKIELSTDLIRGYESGTHTMQLLASFTKSSLLAEGDLSIDEVNEKLVGDYNLNMLYNTRYTLGMHHFWNGYDGVFTADYLMAADYYPDLVGDDKVAKGFKGKGWNLFRQELHMRYGHYSLSSRVDYAVYSHALSQFSNTLGYSGSDLGIRLTHTRKEALDDPKNVTQNEITFDGHYRQNDRITWYGGYTYDIRKNYSKDWKAGLHFDRKCWNFTFVFKQEITPVLTKSGEGSIRNNSFSFQFNLVPFGGVGSKSFTKVSDVSGS